MRTLVILITRPWFLITAGIVALLWLGWLALFEWPANAMVPARQNELLRLVAKKKFGKCDPYLSESYLDQWNFNKSDALLALEDIGSQFFVLNIEVKDPFHSIDGRTAKSEARLTLSGSGSPIAQLIIGRARRLEAPFVFHWQKDSWTPWSWRIMRIENAAIPHLEGYQPGDLTNALRNPGALTP